MNKLAGSELCLQISVFVVVIFILLCLVLFSDLPVLAMDNTNLASPENSVADSPATYQLGVIRRESPQANPEVTPLTPPLTIEEVGSAAAYAVAAVASAPIIVAAARGAASAVLPVQWPLAAGASAAVAAVAAHAIIPAVTGVLLQGNSSAPLPDFNRPPSPPANFQGDFNTGYRPLEGEYDRHFVADPDSN